MGELLKLVLNSSLRFGRDELYARSLNCLAQYCLLERQVLKAEGLLQTALEVTGNLCPKGP